MKTLLNPIHLACRVDEFAPNKRLIEIRRGIATASNGIIVARIDLRAEFSGVDPEQLDLLDGKYIDMEVWKDIHDADKVTFTEDGIHCDKNGIGKSFDYSTPQGEFFNIDSIIITIRDAGESPKAYTRFNLKQLDLFRRIFDANEITFAHSHGNVGTLVFPDRYSGMFGVIMPILSDEKQTRYFFTT